MAFNFLGTINSLEEFEEFEEFINVEYTHLEKRISHLEVEKQRFDELLDKFSMADLSLRAPYSKSDIPDKDWLSSPRQIPKKLKNYTDASNGVDVALLKKMFLDPIKSKRERNEFKVKKIRDLIYQMEDEISFLNNEKEDYLSVLERIRSKFQLDQFPEAQEFDKEDEDGIRATPKSFGIKETSTTKEYMVTAINMSNNSIVFERAVPPVKKGDTFTMTNGKNDGVKTVVGFLSLKTVVVAEPLNAEESSASWAIFKKG